MLNVSHKTRAPLHSYCETEYPPVLKYDDEKMPRMIKCYQCGTYANLSDYHYGYKRNNIDKWSSGECPGCGETLNHEWNYDDYEKVLPLGNYLNKVVERYVYHKYLIMDVHELIFLLEDIPVYDINEPNGIKRYKTTGAYVNQQVSFIIQK